MSKLDVVRKSKIKAAELAQELDTLGQDSEEKAAKAVIEKGQEEEKIEAKKEADSLEKITDARRNDNDYTQALLREAKILALGYDLPKGFLWSLKVTSKGLALFIKAPNGKMFAHGMKIIYEPYHDMKGSHALLIKGLDFMDSWKK